MKIGSKWFLSCLASHELHMSNPFYYSSFFGLYYTSYLFVPLLSKLVTLCMLFGSDSAPLRPKFQFHTSPWVPFSSIQLLYIQAQTRDVLNLLRRTKDLTSPTYSHSHITLLALILTGTTKQILAIAYNLSYKLNYYSSKLISQVNHKRCIVHKPWVISINHSDILLLRLTVHFSYYSKFSNYKIFK